MVFRDSDRRLGDNEVIQCQAVVFLWPRQVLLTQNPDAEYVDYLLPGHRRSKVGIQPSSPPLYATGIRCLWTPSEAPNLLRWFDR